jgi:hypothetical protein
MISHAIIVTSLLFFSVFSSHFNLLVVELLPITTHGFHVLKQLAQDDKDGDL